MNKTPAGYRNDGDFFEPYIQRRVQAILRQPRKGAVAMIKPDSGLKLAGEEIKRCVYCTERAEQCFSAMLLINSQIPDLLNIFPSGLYLEGLKVTFGCCDEHKERHRWLLTLIKRTEMCLPGMTKHAQLLETVPLASSPTNKTLM